MTTTKPITEHARRSLNSRFSGFAGRVPLHEDPAKKHKRVCKWLRDHTSNLDYGSKWRGGVVHCNTNEETLAYLTRKREWLGRITNVKFARHFSGQDTFYFAGCRGGNSLVMLDIDCHKRGTLQGAQALGSRLRDYFPNLYTEVSTCGASKLPSPNNRLKILDLLSGLNPAAIPPRTPPG